jgi:large subunit ribosomal protein L46
VTAVCWRTFATEASTQPPSTLSPPSGPVPKARKPALSTAIIVNRSPLLTKTPTPLERAYYTYQARLRRALSNPFPSEFYFKQGSILETRFNVEERQREKFNFGPNFRKLDDLEKERIAKEDAMAEQLGKQEGEDDVLMSRVHPADKARDMKSLDRKGRRNLYLLVKTEQDTWRFPQGEVQKGELLHQVCIFSISSVFCLICFLAGCPA